MLQLWIQLPLVARYGLLAIAGMLAGGLANHAIYTWCWFPRPISPWVGREVLGRSRRWADRIPLVGWLLRRPESAALGTGFWVRPLLVETALALAFPALYWFHCVAGGLLPEAARDPGVMAAQAGWFHQVFLLHACLLTLMTAATFIDFDEQTIPDLITVPGTLLALACGAATPLVWMPVVVEDLLSPVLFFVPGPLDPQWLGAKGWWLGLTIWTGWCFALADRRVILRRGPGKAIRYFFAGLVRHPSWVRLAAMWVLGLIAVTALWRIGGLAWLGLLTSLIGLAVGGGVVWAVRIVASSAMRMEAMGFGDVTLMAMIGATIGWQASLAAFFLAPFAAIGIVLVQYAVTREPRVPFGPYLCAGAMMTILGWDAIANGWLLPNIALLGPVLLWLSGLMLILMAVLLLIWRWIKFTLLGR